MLVKNYLHKLPKNPEEPRPQSLLHLGGIKLHSCIIAVHSYILICKFVKNSQMMLFCVFTTCSIMGLFLHSSEMSWQSHNTTEWKNPEDYHLGNIHYEVIRLFLHVTLMKWYTAGSWWRFVDILSDGWVLMFWRSLWTPSSGQKSKGQKKIELWLLSKS